MPSNEPTTDGMPSEFSLEELAWFHPDGTMDQSLTLLTNLDKEEFEKMMHLIRWCHDYVKLS